jgi:obg-like ATPase 1
VHSLSVGWYVSNHCCEQAEYTKGKENALRLNKIIKQGFKQLNLMNFFTVGADEVRSWTVYSGATAPQCAGVIHTDFERGFIKAEVCSYDDYKAITTKPSDAEVKAAGKYRQEGKTYVFQDGDITHFQFNVRHSDAPERSRTSLSIYSL